jgi:hypothetical protein
MYAVLYTTRYLEASERKTGLEVAGLSSRYKSLRGAKRNLARFRNSKHLPFWKTVRAVVVEVREVK